jgi:hypothetical protein
MKTVVRTHVRDVARLRLLRRTLTSLRNKGVWPVDVVDDHSPMGSGVRHLCDDFETECHLSLGNKGHTINGLVSSFLLADVSPIAPPAHNAPAMLCLTDDCVVGKGIAPEIKRMEQFILDAGLFELPIGMAGTFACYENRPEFHHTGLWRISTEALYALVCHVYSPRLMYLATKEWTGIVDGTIADPCCCDDIFIKRICLREGLACFNTLKDYAQHTGINERSFGETKEVTGSHYVSKMFVGE